MHTQNGPKSAGRAQSCILIHSLTCSFSIYMLEASKEGLTVKNSLTCGRCTTSVTLDVLVIVTFKKFNHFIHHVSRNVVIGLCNYNGFGQSGVLISSTCNFLLFCRLSHRSRCTWMESLLLARCPLAVFVMKGMG